MLFYLLLIASCTALASLLTALLAWRGRESKWTYTLVFLFLSYVLIVSASEVYLTEETDAIDSWVEVLQAFDQPSSNPKNCPNAAESFSAARWAYLFYVF